MAFHDVRLPTDVERGASGGPRFKTTIAALASGYEKRNIEWERVRSLWDVGYGIQSKEDYIPVRDFFYARQGRAHSFRFKDWADFEISEDGTPQQIGTGNNSAQTFQINKRYTSGGETYSRPISKPVNGTLQVYLNGVEQLSGWTCDYSTGIISFTTPPGNLVAVQVICEFDVPVRFDQDDLDITIQMFDAGAIPQISVIEVRGE